MSAPLLLGCDPSLRAAGWAVVELSASTPPIVAVGCCRTKRSAELAALIRRLKRAKKKIPALPRQVDATKRASAIAEAHAEVLREHQRIEVISIETPLGAQDASAAWAMARGHQAVASACRLVRPDLAPFYVSSHGAKWAATGEKVPKGGKDAVRAAVKLRWGPTVVGELLAGFDAVEAEAITDALAVALLTMRTRAVRFLMMESEGA